MKMWNWRGTEIEGVVFKAREWIFDEDGLAGAIYFDVAPDTFIEGGGGNNGASVVVVESDGGEYQRVRVATPCMGYESDALEDPSPHFTGDYLHQAAEFALRNLRRLVQPGYTFKGGSYTSMAGEDTPRPCVCGHWDVLHEGAGACVSGLDDDGGPCLCAAFADPSFSHPEDHTG